MKKLFAVLSSAFVCAAAMTISVFAGEPYAYFEGEDQNVSGFLDKMLAGLDAKMLMGNWYLIIIGMVIIACAVGIIVTYTKGLIRFIRKKKASKSEKQA